MSKASEDLAIKRIAFLAFWTLFIVTFLTCVALYNIMAYHEEHNIKSATPWTLLLVIPASFFFSIYIGVKIFKYPH